MDETTLLDELKNRLRVTWNDEDLELQRIINRAKSYFLTVTGKEYNFGLEDDETEMLLERCRYVYNNAADEFKINYGDELKRMIALAAIEKRAATDGEHEN